MQPVSHFFYHASSLESRTLTAHLCFFFNFQSIWTTKYISLQTLSGIKMKVSYFSRLYLALHSNENYANELNKQPGKNVY